MRRKEQAQQVKNSQVKPEAGIQKEVETMCIDVHDV